MTDLLDENGELVAEPWNEPDFIGEIGKTINEIENTNDVKPKDNVCSEIF